MKPIGDIAKRNKKRYTVKPRYTVVLHQVRERLDLSLSTYVVIDSVHKLSRTNPDHPYCTMSKEQLASFLKISRATVFRAIQEGIEKRLLDRTSGGALRSTQKWAELAELYAIKT